ncbi:serine/threonine protein kinase [Streptosporangium becharense]|uniref:Serine/threonine protein kinase n=1 Tax=Streptosporangium becharense TaxID=1816182 RepID=A0A7W9MIM9_9ACTN|nr:hypothetical protein [Streptosporangium becharense]MBB2911244.1 serine/threonine protein kinase [Streptosporangium becharense]MBB5821698.1 serine/threonine protein kinase [Streptosporangium becharense]
MVRPSVKGMRILGNIGEQGCAELIARVMREADIMARLRHPMIVTAHDVLTEDGRPRIVMERLHGRGPGDGPAARSRPSGWPGSVPASNIAVHSVGHPDQSGSVGRSNGGACPRDPAP